ncbi:hypothetical protein [Bacillus phage SRT01hs]|uniref:Uncharacterized protein n=1 Tax=Bacillus phage SRT01hs TaxID=2847044 RepID=A0A6B9SWE0_9CAUD|nr:hypothetical protein H3022_gp03 [Bacillus phage SRT01hs]QHJ75861.1 hypothetical protein [Bacillus phage SRT01hs]
MFTLEDFIAMVEEEMSFTTISMNITEEGTELTVYYEDNKATNFHNYKIIDDGEIVTLEIRNDCMDEPIEVLMPEDLEHAFQVMKDYDDELWTRQDSIYVAGDLL